MDLMQEARKLIKDLQYRMSPSPYDIAWMARLRDPVTQAPRWPHLVQWLLENQHSDGSWGAKLVYYHDRIICTLIAAIALSESGSGRESEDAICRAEKYIWRNLHLLHTDPFELVGFELLFPTLIQEAQRLGLKVPNHAAGYDKIQIAKLRLIPPEMLYSPHATTKHSLEFLGRNADPTRIAQALGPNGSLGNSPAATAYFLMFGEHQPSLDYLNSALAATGLPLSLFPYRYFELTWMLNTLSYSQRPIKEFADDDIWQELKGQFSDRGLGLDPTFNITDGDITSVTSRLLTEVGYPVDPMVLFRYQNPETRIFRTYPYERNMSIGTNVHALEALCALTDFPDRVNAQREVVSAILDRRIYNMYWIDKWHASPYYATSHVLIGFLRFDSYLAHAARYTVDWLINTQRDDGSWGFFGEGTAEETAYALTALLHLHRHEPLDTEMLRRGAAYLMKSYELPQEGHAALWIYKCLCIMDDIVRASILAALILYEDTCGSLPG